MMCQGKLNFPTSQGICLPTGRRIGLIWLLAILDVNSHFTDICRWPCGHWTRVWLGLHCRESVKHRLSCRGVGAIFPPLLEGQLHGYSCPYHFVITAYFALGKLKKRVSLHSIDPCCEANGERTVRGLLYFYMFPRIRSF